MHRERGSRLPQNVTRFRASAAAVEALQFPPVTYPGIESKPSAPAVKREQRFLRERAIVKASLPTMRFQTLPPETMRVLKIVYLQRRQGLPDYNNIAKKLEKTASAVRYQASWGMRILSDPTFVTRAQRLQKSREIVQRAVNANVLDVLSETERRVIEEKLNPENQSTPSNKEIALKLGKKLSTVKNAGELGIRKLALALGDTDLDFKQDEFGAEDAMIVLSFIKGDNIAQIARKNATNRRVIEHVLRRHLLNLQDNSTMG